MDGYKQLNVLLYDFSIHAGNCSYKEFIKTCSAGKQRRVSLSLLFHFGCCGHYGNYGGDGHCCCGVWMYNAYKTLSITLVYFLLVWMGQMSNFVPLKECISDGKMDQQTDGLMDQPTDRQTLI